MPPNYLDQGPAALLRYLYDRQRAGAELQRLIDMGMVTKHELDQLLTELERKRLARTTRQPGLVEAHITDEGIAWVRARFGDDR